MTSVSGSVATRRAQKISVVDMVRPRWLVGRLLAGGEKHLALPLAEHGPKIAAIRATHAAGPSLRSIEWTKR
jgi:hypothetical protein